MMLLVQPCNPGSGYVARITRSMDGAHIAGLTRAQATQLRDDLTAALNPAPDDSAQWEYEHGGGAIRSERTER
jgi:hypothetical protein